MTADAQPMHSTSKISYHTIAARDLRVGDRMSKDAAAALDHWYDDTHSLGEDVTVLAVEPAGSEEFGDLVIVTLDSDDLPIEARPDQRITVTRLRGA